MFTCASRYVGNFAADYLNKVVLRLQEWIPITERRSMRYLVTNKWRITVKRLLHIKRLSSASALLGVVRGEGCEQFKDSPPLFCSR